MPVEIPMRSVAGLLTGVPCATDLHTFARAREDNPGENTGHPHPHLELVLDSVDDDDDDDDIHI